LNRWEWRVGYQLQPQRRLISGFLSDAPPSVPAKTLATIGIICVVLNVMVRSKSGLKRDTLAVGEGVFSWWKNKKSAG
jgi:hypothetical protein